MMTKRSRFMNISEKFEKGFENHTYQRIDSHYKINIFLGYNDAGRMSMVITENGKVEPVSSSKFIEVQLNRRADNKLALSFDLIDSSYASMFILFCKDIIVLCESVGKELAISNALLRWKYWKELFGKKNSQSLNKQEIKGLIGELYCLKNYMIPKFGCLSAVKSWMGPMLGHKDFEIYDTWFEIKTVSDGAVQFSVSSLEQLESNDTGHLIIVRSDETSEKNVRAYNLNSMVLSIADMIEDQECLNEFKSKLENLGYYTLPEYENYNYVVKGFETYTVNNSFPAIRRKEISNAIGNAQYTIIISKLSEYKEETSI